MKDLNMISQTMSDQVVGRLMHFAGSLVTLSKAKGLVWLARFFAFGLRMTRDDTALDRFVLTCLTILDRFHIKEV